MTGKTLIHHPEVTAITSLSRAEIYRRCHKGTFPKPIRLASRSTVWVKEEVQAWVNERIAERDAKEAA